MSRFVSRSTLLLNLIASFASLSTPITLPALPPTQNETSYLPPPLNTSSQHLTTWPPAPHTYQISQTHSLIIQIYGRPSPPPTQQAILNDISEVILTVRNRGNPGDRIHIDISRATVRVRFYDLTIYGGITRQQITEVLGFVWGLMVDNGPVEIMAATVQVGGVEVSGFYLHFWLEDTILGLPKYQ